MISENIIVKSVLAISVLSPPQRAQYLIKSSYRLKDSRLQSLSDFTFEINSDRSNAH